MIIIVLLVYVVIVELCCQFCCYQNIGCRMLLLEFLVYVVTLECCCHSCWYMSSNQKDVASHVCVCHPCRMILWVLLTYRVPVNAADCLVGVCDLCRMLMSVLSVYVVPVECWCQSYWYMQSMQNDAVKLSFYIWPFPE